MPNIFNLSGFESAVVKANALAAELQLNGHVLPTVGPYPQSAGVNIQVAGSYAVENINEELTTQGFGLFGTPMCFPLKMKLSSQADGDWWLLPVEPMITLGGGHTLVRRNVAKSKFRGSVKERWNQEDYTITIDGLLTKLDDWTYPAADVKKLRYLLEAREPIDVECDLLEYFKIGRMAVERYEMPFTKGEENQRYSITAYSDDDWDLLIKIDS